MNRLPILLLTLTLLGAAIACTGAATPTVVASPGAPPLPIADPTIAASATPLTAINRQLTPAPPVGTAALGGELIRVDGWQLFDNGLVQAEPLSHRGAWRLTAHTTPEYVGIYQEIWLYERQQAARCLLTVTARQPNAGLVFVQVANQMPLVTDLTPILADQLTIQTAKLRYDVLLPANVNHLFINLLAVLNNSWVQFEQQSFKCEGINFASLPND